MLSTVVLIIRVVDFQSAVDSRFSFLRYLQYSKAVSRYSLFDLPHIFVHMPFFISSTKLDSNGRSCPLYSSSLSHTDPDLLFWKIPCLSACFSSWYT